MSNKQSDLVNAIRGSMQPAPNPDPTIEAPLTAYAAATANALVGTSTVVPTPPAYVPTAGPHVAALTLGTDAQRIAQTPVAGFFWTSDTTKLWFWNGAAWVQIYP